MGPSLTGVSPAATTFSSFTGGGASAARHAVLKIARDLQSSEAAAGAARDAVGKSQPGRVLSES
jgi:hypothetical protein